MMIGFILLLIAIILYITEKKKWSLLIFISFCSNGFYVLTDNVMSLKNQDAAVLYSTIIFLYSLIFERNIKYIHNIQIEIILKIFFIFLIFSILFSIFHYNLDIIQIIQGGRRYFIVFAFFFLRKIRIKDIIWLIKLIIPITFIASILYIIQCATGIPVLPDSELYYSTDSVDNTYRYFNYPPYLLLSLFILILHPAYISQKSNNIYIGTMLVALLCTQTRSLIAVTLTMILVGLILKGKVKKSIKYSMIIAICMIPFTPILIERFANEDKSTSGDLESVLKGDFMNPKKGISGTLSYRFALVYERMNYLSERPLGEQIFGMGLLSDQQKELVHKMYNFQIGLINKNTGLTVQLETPDIAYGNLICRLGFIGTIIYLAIWITMLYQSFKYRKQNSLILCLFLFLFNYVFISFTSASISYAEKAIIPMIIIVLMSKTMLISEPQKDADNNEKCKNISNNGGL